MPTRNIENCREMTVHIFELNKEIKIHNKWLVLLCKHNIILSRVTFNIDVNRKTNELELLNSAI